MFFDDDEIESYLLDSISRMLTCARAGIPLSGEGKRDIELGLTEESLDDMVRRLFAEQPDTFSGVSVTTELATVHFRTHTRLGIDQVWPLWMKLKERLKQTVPYAPILLLLSDEESDIMQALFGITACYSAGSTGGMLSLLKASAFSGGEYAVVADEVVWSGLKQASAERTVYQIEDVHREKTEKAYRPLPIEFRLPERVPLENGSVFAVLHTLDELKQFWAKVRHKLPYAAKGVRYGDGQTYLDEYEWVFAPSKDALVETVMRWQQIGIECEWYDWINEEPEDHAAFFEYRDRHRADKIAEGSWSEEDERDYQNECARRNPQNYRGWWVLKNLPHDCDFMDWLTQFGGEEIIDPGLSLDEVAKRFREITFDDWKCGDIGELEFKDAAAMDEEIAYWEAEKAAGDDYYGSENETSFRH